MQKVPWLAAAILVVALAGVPAHADVWDTATDSDDGAGTDNLLVHGSVQVHDLGVRPGPAPDEDWFIVNVPPYSSYEVVIDGFTGDIGTNNLIMQRWNPAATSLLQTAQNLSGSSFAKRMAWINDTATAASSLVRVVGADCETSCTSADQYTIRARETTVLLARFNNTATQSTVLLSQNGSDVSASARVYFWSTSGMLLSSVSLVNFSAKSMSVLATSTAVPGVSGHMTVAHDAPYGMWNVKAVALEPATGFSFDTPGVIRP